MLERVARVRGLPAGELPELVELPAPELAARALEQVARDLPPAARQAQAQLLELLGLVPPGFELLPALGSAYAASLEAFYAGAPPRIFVDRALSPAARRRALAHELVHALQDRAHDLSRRLAYAPGAWDRQGALHALAEADALALVERLELPPAPEPEHERHSAALPGVLRRSLAAAYVDAQPRVAELLALGGFDAVDSVLREPPTSTHELLHPGSPAGPAVASLAPPGHNWQLDYGDVLGEQSLRALLEEWLPAPSAAALAGAWSSDRLSRYVFGARRALLWELWLDGAEPATELAGLLRSALSLSPPARPPGRAAAPVSKWSCGAEGDRVRAVLRQGSRVVLASLGPIPDLAGGCATLETWLEPTASARRTWVLGASPVP